MNTLDLSCGSIIILGPPGFIGANFVTRLLRNLPSGHIISPDSMNDYYNVSLKKYRLSEIEKVAAPVPSSTLSSRTSEVRRVV